MILPLACRVARWSLAVDAAADAEEAAVLAELPEVLPELLEEQPARERTPAAAMTLIREIKVLRFIVKILSVIEDKVKN